MPYIGNVTTSSNVNGSQINNGTITGDKLSLPFDYDSATLYLDSVNNRVGIGTSAPSKKLEIANGDIRLSDGYTLSWGDDTYRIFRNGTQLRFDANNTQALTIDSSQRVGIGTASPLKELQINATTPTIRLEENGGGSKRLEISIDSSALARIDSTQSSGQLLFGTVGTERARIDSSGRLLVGTSTARTSANGVSAGFQVEGLGAEGALSIIRNGGLAYLTLGRSGGNSIGSNTIISNGDELGRISWAAADGTDIQSWAAQISAEIDGTPGSNDTPGRLVFSTTADGAASPTERMRITQNGYFKASNNGSYVSTTAAYHEFTQDGTLETAYFRSSNASPLGIIIYYSAASPNGTSNYFLTCYDSGSTLRAGIRSNGGLANYSANNANLSDINAKKDISLAADTWNCLKEWEIVNYRYKDQPDDADLNLGVIAQQVAESCPEVITIFQEAKEATETEPAQEERLGVKEQQMYWMAIKALQEAQARIEALEADVAQLKGA
jgi:hypothetical protein